MNNLGGIDNYTTVKSGGTLTLSGAANNGFKAESNHATIEQGGIAYINQNAHATDWNIQGITRLSGGEIENSTVDSGGQLNIDWGNAANITINTNGLLQIDQGTLTNATINGELIAGEHANVQGGITVNSGAIADIQAGANTASAQLTLAGKVYLSNRLNPHEAYAFTLDSLQMNGGTVTFGSASSRSTLATTDTTSTLTLNDLSGNGNFHMNTSIADLKGNFLNVTGQADGSFGVYVSDTGHNPANENKLQLIQIANGDANFQLTNAGGVVDIGTYKYELVSDNQGGWHMQPKTQDTQSPQRPVAPSLPGGLNPEDYQITPSAASVLSIASVSPLIFNSELNDVSQQISHKRTLKQGSNIWSQANTSKQRIDLNQSAYEMTISGITLGLDHTFEVSNGHYTQGVFASYSHTDIDFKQGGSGDVHAYGLGTYASYQHNNGFYLDGMLKTNLFRHTVSPVMTSGNKATGQYNTYGAGIKIETGQYFHINDTYITPFISASGFTSESAEYRLSNGMSAHSDKQASVIGSAGIETGHAFIWKNATLKPYARVAFEHEFIDNNKVTINNTDHFQNNLSGSRGVLQTGIKVQSSDRLSFQLGASYSNGQYIESPWKINLGLSYNY